MLIHWHLASNLNVQEDKPSSQRSLAEVMPMLAKQASSQSSGATASSTPAAAAPHPRSSAAAAAVHQPVNSDDDEEEEDEDVFEDIYNAPTQLEQTPRGAVDLDDEDAGGMMESKRPSDGKGPPGKRGKSCTVERFRSILVVIQSAARSDPDFDSSRMPPSGQFMQTCLPISY